MNISIFSLYLVVIRHNKIMRNLLIKYLKILTVGIKSQWNLSELFFALKNTKLGDQLLLLEIFENFDFESIHKVRAFQESHKN